MSNPATQRRRKPKILKFPKPRIADDSQFIETLVWVLNRAREGKISGYVMVYCIDDEDKCTKITEAADCTEDVNRLLLLGAMRRMEANFMEREWPRAK